MQEQACKWLHVKSATNFAPEVIRFVPQESTRVKPPANKARLAKDSFLNDDEEADKEEEEIMVEQSSEVDQYLLLPQLSEGMSFDLLVW
jgi:hypothetical protein